METSLTSFVKNFLSLLYLIRFGAVFYALECPTPPPSASPEQLELYNRVLKLRASRKKERLSLKGKTLKETQKCLRIASPSECIESGTHLRVHVHPKRSPRVYEIDWKSRIIAETEAFVVVDKPAGVSVSCLRSEEQLITWRCVLPMSAEP